MLKHNSTGINKKYDEGETLLHIAVRNNNHRYYTAFD
ncbi:ankyrin [Orientia tsutsugamushi]|uniref:Ankyrin n=1 Tax=Orientia tsutsugamushi TaxID=784 RepID=A0A2R8F441_ORITS|nr:ankyrin [Orientia tsutsugamushi]